jgi:serine/threonine protein phosphatase PrpC
MTLAPTGPGVVLLCSDGLWNYLPDASDLSAALKATLPPDPPTGTTRIPTLATAAGLTRLALELGGHDNVTVVVVPFPLATDPVAATTRSPGP